MRACVTVEGRKRTSESGSAATDHHLTGLYKYCIGAFGNDKLTTCTLCSKNPLLYACCLVPSIWEARPVSNLPKPHHIYTDARSLAPHLQLGLRRGHVLNLLELVEELEALGVEQRAARLDRLARDDALDRQLDLFAIDGDLR